MEAKMLCKLPEETSLKILPFNLLLLNKGLYQSKQNWLFLP